MFRFISGYITCLLLLLEMKIGALGEYSCTTPNEWLGVANATLVSTSSTTAAKSLSSFWPNGNIIYKLNTTLTSSDLEVVYSAIAEYHKKTCVRFVPYKDGDVNFTSIERDDNVCGQSNVCMQGGYQFAKFGKNCRNMNTLVHQLAHSLCLGHEHQRSDRNNYVSLNNDSTQCGLEYSGISKELPTKNIYDYASQMHAECGGCLTAKNEIVAKFGCGNQVTKGLSTLDVDKINQMYGCGGCFRHRWISAAEIGNNSMDLTELTVAGTPSAKLYPCRAFFKDQLAIGTYHRGQKACTVSWAGEAHFLRSNFEVLTIPGGLEDSESTYKLILGTDKMKNYELDALFVNAVPASRHVWMSNGFGNGTGYIGYNSDWYYVPHISIGKVMREMRNDSYKGKAFRTYFPHRRWESRAYVLVCQCR